MNWKYFSVLALAIAVAASVTVPAHASVRVGSRLAFSTYLGTLGSEYATGVAVGPSGEVYVVGQTSSSSFPVANALQPTIGGGVDAFVAKLSADGSHVIWATY